MDTLFYILRQFVIIAIDVLLFAMLIRAIMSFIDPMREGKVINFLTMLTEPVILPVRALCAKFHWFEGIPLDFPFLITTLLLSLIQTLLTVL